MNTRILGAGVLFTVATVCTSVLGGCASVKNYDAISEEDVGFEHFAGKHYLVLEPLKDGGQQLKVLTLPDLSKPRIIKHKPGWGSVQFSLKLQNGVLSDFGSTQDSKGPETLAAVGATVATLGTGYATVLAAQIAAEVTTMSSAMALMEDRDVPFEPTPVSIGILRMSAEILGEWVVAGLSDIDALADFRSSIGEQVDVLFGVSIIDPTEDLIGQIVEAQESTLRVVKVLEQGEAWLRLMVDGGFTSDERGKIVEALLALADEIEILKGFGMAGKQPVFYEIIPRADGAGIDFRQVNLDERLEGAGIDLRPVILPDVQVE